MPTRGAYDFQRASAADEGGVIDDENRIGRGEWAWIERDTSASGGRLWRSMYLRCPDCGELATLWRNFGDQAENHEIDPSGNVTPSVDHTRVEAGVEKCGFHTKPTRLLGFVDRREQG